MKNIYTSALIVWVLFVVLAIINGLVRDEYYPNSLSELVKHQISSAIFIFVLLVVMYVFFNKFEAAYRTRDLWLIGTLWVLLTVIFEFVFGYYIMGNDLNVLYADYNIFSGRLWSLVLIFTFVGPGLVARN